MNFDWYINWKRKKRKERITDMTEACNNALMNGYHNYSKRLALCICFLMLKNNVSREQLVNVLGYSEYDMDRLLSGVLIVSPDELEEIAKIIGTTKKDLVYNSVEDYYDIRSITE